MVSEQHLLTEQEKRDFCSLMLKEYGLAVNMNNELLPVFYLAYKTGQINLDTCRNTNQHISDIIEQFNEQVVDKVNQLKTNQYQFGDSKQAFVFALGKYGIVAIVVSMLIFAGWLINHFHNVKKQQDLQDNLRDKNNFSLFKQTIINQREINDSTLARIITLYPAKNIKEAKAGKNYVFRKACNCIEIPLYYERAK